MVNNEKVTAYIAALSGTFENKSNKKTQIIADGDYSNDEDSYPTIQAVKTWVQSLGFLDAAGAAAKVDVAQGNANANNILATNAVGNVITKEKLGNIDIDGKVGGNAHKPLITDTNGQIIEGDFGTEIHTFCQGNDSRLSNARTPTSHASTGTGYGISTHEKYGHAMASSTEPKMDGTMSVGTETAKFARGDHVHPSDTSRAPASHAHGQITSDGKIGETAGLPVQTTTDGELTTGTFGTTSGTFAEGNHTHNNYAVTLTHLQNPTEGYISTYEISQGGSTLGKIDIPKDYLLKSASLGVSNAADSPEQGYIVGDKYLDFVLNTRDNNSSSGDSHLYVKVSDLVDTYYADESSITVYTDNNDGNKRKFKIKASGVQSSHIADGAITTAKIDAKAVTGAKIADNTITSGQIADNAITTTKISNKAITGAKIADNTITSAQINSTSMPAAGITATDISNWNAKGTSNITVADIDAEIDAYLDAIITGLSS